MTEPHSMIEPQSLLVGRSEPHIVTLTLHRPTKKNALDRELVCNLGDALEMAAHDPHARVVVLTGSGGAFCSGADLPTIVGIAPEEMGERIDEFHRLIHLILDMDKPVIAAVDGPAVGFGADLALACDARVLTSRAYIEEAFVKVGLMPDGGGSYFLPKYTGARAFEILALGRRLEAPQCLELGLCNHLVPEEDLVARSLALAQEFAAMAPLAVAEIKRAARALERAEVKEALKRERVGQMRLARSADFKEGVSAFLGKRKPQFVGK